MPPPARIVVLSDTHGKLPGEVLDACEGAARVIHAGDAGDPGILEEIALRAPLNAVCGNVDPPDLTPVRAFVEVGGWRIFVQHIVWERGKPSREVLSQLKAAPADIVIFGHTHEPLLEEQEGTLFLNPGSCGARRFSLPRAYAEMTLANAEGWIRIFDLDAPAGAPPLMERRVARNESP